MEVDQVKIGKTGYIFDHHQAVDQTEGNIRIHQIHTFDAFKAFFELPWAIYHDDPNWVPAFWEEYQDFFDKNNLFWNHADTRLFIAYENDKAVGRIAVFNDKKFSEQIGEQTGFFGFFECINDKKIVHLLFDAAKHWLQSQSITKMQGPVNGRVDMGCGILIEGFNKIPYFYGTYTPSYYQTRLESYGMKKSKDLISYVLDINRPISESVKQSADRCHSKGITIRRFHRMRTNKELEWWIPLMMDVFSHHWGYIQVPKEEVRNRFGIKQLRYIVDTGLFLVAEKDGKPVGFKWAFPDYNQVFQSLKGHLGIKQMLEFLWLKRKINRGKFHFVGVKKECRGFGIGTCMNYHMLKEMKKRGYQNIEIGWIDEQNTPERKATEKIGAKQSKIYRVYSISF